MQYAPYDLEGGWNDQNRNELGEAVISTIDDYAPNIRQCIVGMQVISPKDIEAIAGITGGNIFHGELLLHQIFPCVPCRNGQISGPRSKAITLGRAAHIPGGCDGCGGDAGGEGDIEMVIGKW